MKVLFFLAALYAATYCKEEKSPMDVIFKVNSQKQATSKFSAANVELREGDIVVTNKLKQFLEDEKNNKSRFDAIVNGAWPNGKVYYSLRRLPSNVHAVVRQAIAVYHAKTCIRFYPRTNQRDYLNFFQGGGCYSMIGRQGGAQQVSLGRGCEQIGVVIHEIMHALGFFHEQSRRDRDRYVKIMWQNIPQRVRYNFETYKHGQANTLGEPYDKSSVMHYGSYAFSSNGRKTIESISNPNERLGQRQGLSRTDIRQLNKYYRCSGSPKTTTTKRPTTNNRCTDTYSLCGKMAEVGLCKVGVAWVPNNCKKSCNQCKKPCQYTQNRRYCGQWQKAGYCQSSRHGSWMKKH